MRDSLTVLAILLIGVLTAALVAPALIDWDSHRALIARKLSEAAGTPVTVMGPIALKLLPRPVVSFGGVTVGGAEAPKLDAASLDAELSLTALMRGQVQLVDATLVRPRLALTEGPDGGFGLDLPSEDVADRVALDHIAVRDATVVLALADGRRLSLTGLDAEGEATSLRGPAKVAGSLGGVPFRLATGALDRGRLRVKLHVDGAGVRPSIDLDGVVSAAAPSAGPGPAFDGTATASGRVALDGTPAGLPWRITARLSADRSTAAAAGVELRAGADMRALIADGSGTAAYAASQVPPRGTLDLHGAVIDLDHLAVAPDDGSVAPPTGSDLLRLLLRAAGGGSALVGLPFRLGVAAKFDTATVAGRTLLGTTAGFVLGPEPTLGLSLALQGPDGARVALDGRLDPGPAPTVAGPFGVAPVGPAAAFRGRAEARSEDLRRTAAWLAPAAPDLAAVLAALPGRSVAAAGTVALSATGLAARDASLRVDGSAFAGTLSYTSAVGAERARLFADLSSDALDLAGLPDLSDVTAATRDLDLDLALSARAVTVVDPRAGAAPGLGAVTAGHVALHVTKVPDALTLERLSLDVGGGRLDATGSRVGSEVRVDAHLSAPQLGPLADVLGRALPQSVAALPRERMASFSPAEVTLRLSARTEDGATPVPTRFALAGTLGGTRVDATLAPDGSARGRSAADLPLDVAVTADAADGADLMRQFGLSAGAGIGAAHLDGSAHGTLTDGFAANLRATLATTSLSYRGRLRAASGDGHATLRSTDLGPVLAGLGLSPPRAGDGVSGDIAADVAWENAAVTLKGIAAQVGSTSASGDLTLDLAPRRPGAADAPVPLRGHLALDRLSAADLLAPALGAPATPIPGSAWSNQPFAAAAVVLPRGEIALRIADLPLRGTLAARGVSLTLRTGGGALAVADAAGALAGGSFGGGFTLRRDGSGAAVSGRIAWTDLAVDLGGLSAKTGGTANFGGTGDTPAAVMASLAGTGTVSLSCGKLARTDPAAPGSVLAAISRRATLAERGSSAPDPTPVDVDALRRDLAAALDGGPLPLDAAALPATLAGGVLRVAPVGGQGSAAAQGRLLPSGERLLPWTADTSLAVDLGRLTSTSRVVLHASGAAPDGADTSVTVTRSGPIGGDAARDIDVAGLVAAVQAQAIARAQERIDVMEQDIRERAAFNRQLKAIAADQQAARDKAEADRKAAAEAQKVAADARRAEAARQKAEDARVQAQVESAARADAAARDEAAKQRFFDRALKSADPPLDLGARDAPLDRLRAPASRVPRSKGRDPFDPPAPPSIIREKGTGDPTGSGLY